jgi:hydrogenase maturation factor
MSELAAKKGIRRCLRYAFMPNHLHLCGPEKQADILNILSKDIWSEKTAKEIGALFGKFETMYPYLRLIARANKISAPLSEEIVEAYWLGSNDLGKIRLNDLLNHLVDAIGVKKRLGFQKFNDFLKNFGPGAVAHHNFHVFNVFSRTGKVPEAHTIASMDACRISWGLISKIEKNKLIVKTRPLEMNRKGEIFEAAETEKIISNETEGVKLIEKAQKGDFISIHWGSACEIIDQRQIKNLQRYTDSSLALANKSAYDRF